MAIVALCLCLVHGTAWSRPPDPLSGGSVDEFGKYMPAETVAMAEDLPADSSKWLEHAAGMIEDLGDGKHRIGLVLIDSKSRSVTIPARVHARSGLVEYALVTEKGKVHEALLTTKASPLHVHLAALLAGLAAEKNDVTRPIEVWLEWQGNGPARRQRLEEWVALAEESPSGDIGGTLETGDWTYHGSVLDQQGFAASREGSLISLIGDLAALVLNPRPGRVNDKLHVPNAKVMPPEGFPVSVIFRPAALDVAGDDAEKAAPP
ncbi:MAG: YdjY domain-containing protein [Luteolibacter sp.]